MWHHVDGCWGGSVILSQQHRFLTDGIERSDSFAWNPHKMIGCALQTSILLVAGGDTRTNVAITTDGKNALMRVNGTSATYLFQKDKLYGEYDTGDKTIQCGRKTDCLKLWLMWKHLGDEGLRQTVDRCFSLLEYMHAKLLENDQAWVVVVPPSCTNICFWYVPQHLRPFDPYKEGGQKRTALHRVAPYIKARMQKEGCAMIGFQIDATVRNGHDVNFFRMVFASCDTVMESDVDETMADIARIGEEMVKEE
jgi:glutamate/tyrosine decarboxylase-like PLP-dependent enzyme